MTVHGMAVHDMTVHDMAVHIIYDIPVCNLKSNSVLVQLLVESGFRFVSGCSLISSYAACMHSYAASTLARTRAHMQHECSGLYGVHLNQVRLH